jgi:hypothetical protein
MACDGQNYYSFSDTRGLSRASKNASAEWKIAKVNGSDEAKKLKGVTFLQHKDKLYIRHKGAPDVPFQELNKEDMTIRADQEPITPIDGQEARFKWDAETEEKEQTPYGKRWMGITPMASDGKYIYAMLNYRESGPNSDRKSTFIEIYELHDDNKIEFKSDIELKDADEKSWPGRKTLNDNGGYLDHGYLAANPSYVVWASRKNYHVFSLKTGVLLHKQSMHSGNHLTMYDSTTSKFYSCDADCYSWLDEWTIKGFKTVLITDEEDEEGEAKLPAVPVILDDPKGKIRKNMVKAKDADYQLNIFSQLIGGAMESSV